MTSRYHTVAPIAGWMIAACVVAPSGPVLAHHSFAIYDSENPVELTGVVEELRWTNPHTWIVLAVANDDGSTTHWEFELGPINMMSRQGWTPTTLEPGDRIVVRANPLHSGDPGGRYLGFEFVESAESFEALGQGTILNVPRPEPAAMSDAVARNFNGVWINANGGIHFDTMRSRTRRGQEPPLRPAYMDRWLQRWADADAGLATTDPTAECLPPGVPRFLTMVLPGEILQAEHQLNWYAEFGEATLRVYLDGRDPPANLYPTYNGFTTGHWEGNTLVATTNGLRDDTLVDTTGVPHSDQLTVTMRMTKVTPDYFEVDVTLDDPVAFTGPWQTIKHYVRAPEGAFVQEYACLEGNRMRIGTDGAAQRVFE